MSVHTNAPQTRIKSFTAKRISAVKQFASRAALVMGVAGTLLYASACTEKSSYTSCPTCPTTADTTGQNGNPTDTTKYPVTKTGVVAKGGKIAIDSVYSVALDSVFTTKVYDGNMQNPRYIPVAYVGFDSSGVRLKDNFGNSGMVFSQSDSNFVAQLGTIYPHPSAVKFTVQVSGLSTNPQQATLKVVKLRK